jgi:hypothetical protein
MNLLPFGEGKREKCDAPTQGERLHPAFLEDVLSDSGLLSVTDRILAWTK